MNKKKIALSISGAIGFVISVAVIVSTLNEASVYAGLEFYTSEMVESRMVVRNPEGVWMKDDSGKVDRISYGFGDVCTIGSGSRAKTVSRLKNGEYLVRLTDTKPYFSRYGIVWASFDTLCPDGTLTTMSAEEIQYHRESYPKELDEAARHVAALSAKFARERELLEEIRSTERP